jgi:hypothetical protein
VRENQPMAGQKSSAGQRKKACFSGAKKMWLDNGWTKTTSRFPALFA